jgi:hypothetical protein
MGRVAPQSPCADFWAFKTCTSGIRNEQKYRAWSRDAGCRQVRAATDDGENQNDLNVGWER